MRIKWLIAGFVLLIAGLFGYASGAKAQCGPTDTCATQQEVRDVYGCELHFTGDYCIDLWNNVWKSCTGKPSCYADTNRYTRCDGTPAGATTYTGCVRAGYESTRSCCSPGCTPNCTGRECGDDGCGGSCGTCNTGEACNAAGGCYSTCSCSWTDSNPITCGNETNGCNFLQKKQTYTCSSSGCGEGATQCVAETGICSWPAEARGYKRIGCSGSPATPVNVADDLVSLSTPAVSSTGNPYFLNWNTEDGGNRSISVAADTGTYDVGYSLCYNDTGCHSCANFVGGLSAPISDNSIRTLNKDIPGESYADLWWHYCPKAQPPLNLAVSSCVPGGMTSGTATLTWNHWMDSTNGTISTYAIRVDDTANLWSGSCASVNPGDYCLDVPANPTSFTFNVTAGHSYSVWIHTRNECGGTSSPASLSFVPTRPPTGPGTVTATDTGGEVRVSWTTPSDGQRFRIYRGATDIGTVSPATTAFLDMACIGAPAYIYTVTAEDMTKPASPAPGCQTSPGTSNAISCNTASDSWWAASGGGNLVAAVGSIRSAVPPSTYFMHNAEGLYPGIALYRVGISTFTSTSVNNRRWLFNTTAPGWGATGNNYLSERENTFDAMKERLAARADIYQIPVSVGTLDQFQFDSAYGSAQFFGTTGVKIMEWNDPGTLNIGPLDLTAGQKALIMVGGNVNLTGTINWPKTSPGFMAILARGNMTVGTAVGDDNSAQLVDIRDPAYPMAHLMGVYYAQGLFSTGRVASGEDRLLRIDGTVVGIGGVNLQRVNRGKYPVEFFNYQPEMITELSLVGLRRKVVRELLNP